MAESLPLGSINANQNGSCPPRPKADSEPKQDAADDARRGRQGHSRELSNLQSKRWSEAGRKVTTLLSLSRGFKTLRDQYAENTILPEELQTIKSLGQGAFAKVELCHYCPQKQRSPGSQDSKPPSRIVAVKSLKPGTIGSSPDELDALLKEVALMRKLKHKHIVSYVGMGNHGNEAKSTFLVEEALPGGSAKRLVVRQLRQLGTRIYNYADALRWSCQVADGMAYLHSCRPQVIHRDLKLENILLKGETASTSIAKITDFGLSAIVKKKMLGEIALASRRSVEANNLARESSRTSARRRPNSASSMTGRSKANRRRRAATAKKGSMPSIMSDSDPAVLQARWNVTFAALSRKVQAAEQHHAIAQRAQSRLSCDFHLEPQDLHGQPWHTGHPNISQAGHASATSSIVSSTAGSHGAAAFSRIQTFSSQALDATADNRESTGKPVSLVMLEDGGSKRTSRPTPSKADDAGPPSASSAQQAEKSCGLPIIREASLHQEPSFRRASQVPHLPSIVAGVHHNRAKYAAPSADEASEMRPESMSSVHDKGPPELLHMESIRHEDHEPLRASAQPHIIHHREVNGYEDHESLRTSAGLHRLQHLESDWGEDHEHPPESPPMEPLWDEVPPESLRVESVQHADHEHLPESLRVESVQHEHPELAPAASLHPRSSLAHVGSLRHEGHAPQRASAPHSSVAQVAESVPHDTDGPSRTSARPHTAHHVESVRCGDHETLFASARLQPLSVHFSQPEAAGHTQQEPVECSGACPDQPMQEQQQQQQQQHSHHDVADDQLQQPQHFLQPPQRVSLPGSMAGSGFLLSYPFEPGARKTRDMPTRSPSHLHVRVDSLPRTAVVSREPSFHEAQRNSQGLLGVDVPGAVLTPSNERLPKSQAHTVISRSREVPVVTAPDVDALRSPGRHAEGGGVSSTGGSRSHSPRESAAPIVDAPPHDGGILHPPPITLSTAPSTGAANADGAQEAEEPPHSSMNGVLSGAEDKLPIPASKHRSQHLTNHNSDNLLGALNGPPSSMPRKEHGKRGEVPDKDRLGTKGSQGLKEVRSPGASLKSKKPSGAAVRADKKKQKIATELRQVVDEHVQLSGRIGTLLYMSPEVYRSEYYDEKSDVFSFGVIMYELFHRFLVVFAAAPSGNQNEVEQYAEQVSQGYRPPLGSHIPFSLACLIRDCGAQNPKERPTMAVVVERLKAIEAEGIVARMDELPEVIEEGCSCTSCSIM